MRSTIKHACLGVLLGCGLATAHAQQLYPGQVDNTYSTQTDTSTSSSVSSSSTSTQGYQDNQGNSHGTDAQGDVKYDNRCNSHRAAECGGASEGLPNPSSEFAFSLLGAAFLAHRLRKAAQQKREVKAS